MTNQHKTKTKHNKARKSDQTSLGRIFYLAFLLTHTYAKAEKKTKVKNQR